MRRWGLLLSIAACAGFLALTNPTSDQLYTSLFPKLQAAARQEATKPTGGDRFLENFLGAFGTGGAALGAGLVGANQADREAAYLADFKPFFFSHLKTSSFLIGSTFTGCWPKSDGTTIGRTWIGAAGTFLKIREGAC